MRLVLRMRLKLKSKLKLNLRLITRNQIIKIKVKMKVANEINLTPNASTINIISTYSTHHQQRSEQMMQHAVNENKQSRNHQKLPENDINIGTDLDDISKIRNRWRSGASRP